MLNLNDSLSWWHILSKVLPNLRYRIEPPPEKVNRREGLEGSEDLSI